MSSASRQASCLQTSAISSSDPDPLDDRRAFLTKSGATAAAAAVATVAGGLTMVPRPASAASQMWTPVDIPFDDTLYDIDFDTADHGYLVGSRGAFAETNDGGRTWQARSFTNLDAEEEVRPCLDCNELIRVGAVTWRPSRTERRTFDADWKRQDKHELCYTYRSESLTLLHSRCLSR